MHPEAGLARTAPDTPGGSAPTRREADPCHVCKAPPVHLWMRRPTEDEAAAHIAEIRRHRRDDLHLPGELTYQAIAALYGPPQVAVTGCADHDLAPAAADDSPEGADAAAQAGLDRRALLHDAECAGHDACTCLPSALEGP